MLTVLRILTSIVAILMVSSPTLAAQKKPSPLKIQNNDAQAQEAQMDDKPLPLFTKFETEGERVAASPTAPVSQEAREESVDSAKQPQAKNKAAKLKVAKTETKPEAKPEQAATTVLPEVKSEAKLEQGATPASPEAVITDTQQAVLETEHNTQDKVASNEQTQDLQVVDFVLTNQVVNREPKEVLENFAEGAERGVAFARLKAKTNTTVTFVWYRNDREYTRYKAPVHSSGKQWRTFSSVKLRPGDWKVQLLGENKEVLAEKTFSIK